MKTVKKRDLQEITEFTTYLRLLLFTGTNFGGFLKIVDLAGINFSDFAITCSINSKLCNKF